MGHHPRVFYSGCRPDPLAAVCFRDGGVIVRRSRFKRVTMPSAVTELFQNADVGYQALLETVADPIVAFVRDGKIVLWNSAAETTFGWRSQEALGASLFNLVIGEASLASDAAMGCGLCGGREAR